MSKELGEKINALNERVVKLEAERNTERKWFGIFATILLGWIGATSLIQVPNSTNKWLKDRDLEHLEKEILSLNKAVEKGIVADVIKTRKVQVFDEDGRVRAEISVGNEYTEDYFTDPAIILYDAVGNIRSTYGLEKNGSGHLAFRNVMGYNEIVVTNSELWELKESNFLRRNSSNVAPETVFE